MKFMNENRVLVVMIGPPASGKSTYVNNYMREFQVVSADDMRLALGTQFNNKLEPMVHTICEYQCRALMERGKNIVIDDCNTNVSRIKRWTPLVSEYSYKSIGIIHKVSLDECMKRNSERDDSVPSEVILRMFENMQKMLLVDELNLHFHEVYALHPNRTLIKQ